MTQAFRNFLNTFYSRDFYAELIGSWRGIGIGFVLLLTLINSIGSLALLGKLAPVAASGMTAIATQMPAVTVAKGRITIDKPSPYTVRPAATSAVSIIKFDTNQSHMDVLDITKQMEKEDLAVLVTSDVVAVKKKNGVEVHSVTDFAKEDVTVSHENWDQLNRTIQRWGVIAIVVAVPLLSFIVAFICTLVKSIIVQIASLFYKDKPDFSGAMRLAAAAAVPGAVFANLYAVFVGPTPSFAEFGIWAVFMLIGLFSYNAAARPPRMPV